MDHSPLTSPAAADLPPASPTRRPEWGTWIAWAVILTCVGVITGANFWRPRLKPEPLQPIEVAKKDTDETRPGMQSLYIGRYIVGLKSLANSTAGGGATTQAQMSATVLAAAKTPADRVRAAVVIGEIDGPRAALRHLNRLSMAGGSTLGHDIESLRTVYSHGPEALGPEDRRGLIDHHGWFGRLALSNGKPPQDAERVAVLSAAGRTAVAAIAALVAVIGGGIVGLVLLIVAIIQLANRRVRLAYSSPYAPPLTRVGQSPRASIQTDSASILLPRFPPIGSGYAGSTLQAAALPSLGTLPAPMGATPAPVMASPGEQGQAFSHLGGPSFLIAAPSPLHPLTLRPLGERSPRTGPFLEAFAIYLAAQLLLGIVIRLLVHDVELWMEWFMLLVIPVALLWPLWRGVAWPELRRGLGWYTGRGVTREMAAGVLAYLGGLPIFAIGIGLTLLLGKLAGGIRASHPMENDIGKSTAITVQIYLLACVWAPLVEETFFRGAFFHHLRRRWNWLISAAVVSGIFAAIHPQGWTAIPALASLAWVFAGIREWRGSIFASVAAHALNNFLVTTLMVLAIG